MRVLFVHIASNMVVEYKVHNAFASRCDGNSIESFFAWQESSEGFDNSATGSLLFDFGRDYSITPRPSRIGRIVMMSTKFPFGFLRLLRFARRIKPDLIYTSAQRYDVYVGRVVAVVLGVPHLVHLHYPVGPWLGRLTVFLLRRTAVLLSCSNFVKSTAAQQGIDPSRVEVVHNVSELGEFASAGEERKSGDGRPRLGLAIDAPVVISAGRLDPTKGHWELLDAFAKIVRNVPEARLVICGETNSRDGYDGRLRQHASDLGIGDQVIFTGFSTDLPELFAEADIFCLPSNDEAFGLVYIEAMAAALPVVALRSGAVPEIVVDGETGLLSDPEDAHSLEANLSKLIQDRGLAWQMGRQGRDRVGSAFHPDRLSLLWEQNLLSISTRSDGHLGWGTTSSQTDG